MFKITCEDCQKVFVGDDEYDAELKFNNHDCIMDDYYNKMSLKELREHTLK